MRRWAAAECGMDGPRGQLPPQADDPVAHKLLEAADAAMLRGDWRRGVKVLRLMVKDYHDSQEASFARSVLYRPAERANGHTR